MPATGATGARRSANHVRTHRKSSPRPQRLCVPSSQPGSRNEAERRGEPPQETSRQRCYRQCASRRAIAFPHRFPDAISSGRKYSQCGEIWTWITSRIPQDGADAFDELFKALFRALQFFLPGGSQPVELGFAVGVRRFPLGANPSAHLHAVQSGIERAFLHGQQLIGGSLDVQNNSVAVQLSHLRKSFQNEEVETSLKVISCHAKHP